MLVSNTLNSSNGGPDNFTAVMHRGDLFRFFFCVFLQESDLIIDYLLLVFFFLLMLCKLFFVQILCWQKSGFFFSFISMSHR